MAKDQNGEMSASPDRNPADEAPASVPQTTPVQIGYGHPEYQFVQAIMEMQKSIGEVKASIDSVKSSVDGMKAKVDDLVNWKHRIIGGAAVLGVVFTLMGILIGKFWDYFTIRAPGPPAAVQIPAQIPPAPEQPKTATKK